MELYPAGETAARAARLGSADWQSAIVTRRNGLVMIAGKARAVELFPTLPTPFRMTACGIGSTAVLDRACLILVVMGARGWSGNGRVRPAAPDAARAGGKSPLRRVVSQFDCAVSDASSNETISLTSQSRTVTPAAIAGVQRKVLWMRTKL